jgi:hypothetical protein
MTTLPNKFPQYFFYLGLIAVSIRFSCQISKTSFAMALLLVFLIVGSHGIGIQIGTAMLDIVTCYLLIAALDSLVRKTYFLAVIEFTFLFWSKSFMPLQMVFVVMVLMLAWFICSKAGITRKLQYGFHVYGEISLGLSQRVWLFLLGSFILTSSIVALPFLWRSFSETGTPLFPFGVGWIHFDFLKANPARWENIRLVAEHFVTVAQANYGYGVGLLDWIRHLWILAVPTRGVNNVFDYPLGLTYLLVVGPFIWMLIRNLQQKTFPIVPIIAVLIWISWWFGSQQSRFFYPVLILMFVTVVGEIKYPSRLFITCLLIALGLNNLSLVRAHKTDFLKPAYQVLRVKDKELVVKSNEYVKANRTDLVEVSFPDVAYARFPVVVNKTSGPWILVEEVDSLLGNQ